MERAEAVKLLNGLKRNTCWCEVGIGNPNYRGKHTAACLAVQEFMKAEEPLPICPVCQEQIADNQDTVICIEGMLHQKCKEIR